MCIYLYRTRENQHDIKPPPPCLPGAQGLGKYVEPRDPSAWDGIVWEGGGGRSWLQVSQSHSGGLDERVWHRAIHRVVPPGKCDVPGPPPWWCVRWDFGLLPEPS